MEIVKLLKNQIEDIDLPENVNEVYYLKNKLEMIGYGFINYNSLNEIEIFIKEDYREEGNGKILFDAIYKDFNKKDIHLRIDLNNYPMLKIVEEYNGLDLGTNDGFVSYVIKKD